jgi:hypothetical protein
MWAKHWPLWSKQQTTFLIFTNQIQIWFYHILDHFL